MSVFAIGVTQFIGMMFQRQAHSARSIESSATESAALTLLEADLGRIDIQPAYTLFDVNAEASKKLGRTSLKFKGKNVAVTPA